MAVWVRLFEQISLMNSQFTIHNWAYQCVTHHYSSKQIWTLKIFNFQEIGIHYFDGDVKGTFLNVVNWTCWDAGMLLPKLISWLILWGWEIIISVGFELMNGGADGVYAGPLL